MWSFWCIYFSYNRHRDITVVRDITVNGGNNTDVASKNCAPFSACKTDWGCVYWWSKRYLHCDDYVQFDWVEWYLFRYNRKSMAV